MIQYTDGNVTVFQSALFQTTTTIVETKVFDQYNINLLVPGHGRATTNRVEMKHRVDMSRDYLARLKEAVVNKNKDVIEALALEFRFPSSFTKQYHDKNVEILKKELNVE